MRRQDEILSMEKLLKTIRATGTSESSEDIRETVRPSLLSPLSGHLEKKQVRLSPFRGRVTIGADMGLDALRLVKVHHLSESNRKVLETCLIPLDPEMAGNSLELSRLLRQTLKDFCNGISPEIWLSSGIERLETEYLTLARIPKKQISNAAFWTFREKHRDTDITNHIFDFEILGETEDSGRIAIMSCRVPRKAVENLKNLFDNAGYPLTGISPYPFAIQNLLKSRLIVSDEKNICCLYVGAEQSRIDIFLADGSLVLSRQVRACLAGMIDAIQSHSSGMTQPKPGAFGPWVSEKHTVRDRQPMSRSEAQRLLDRLLGEAVCEEGNEAGWECDFTAEQVFGMVRPPLDRLMWQVERTIQAYYSEIGRGPVEKLLVYGEINHCPVIIDYINSYFGTMDISAIDPFREMLSGSETALDSRPPAERNRFVSAAGMAFSRNFFTPNLIFTHKEKKQHQTVARIHRSVTILFLLLIFLCTGWSMWQEKMLRERRDEAMRLQNEITQMIQRDGMEVNRAVIDTMSTHIETTRNELRSIAREFLGMAVIETISESTPETIRILRLEINGLKPADSLKNNRLPAKEDYDIIMEGHIEGDPRNFQSILIKYHLSLSEKAVFRDVLIYRKNEETRDNEKVLAFIIHLGLVKE